MSTHKLTVTVELDDDSVTGEELLEAVGHTLLIIEFPNGDTIEPRRTTVLPHEEN